MRSLTTDLSRDDLRPYFLWDEDVSIGEFKAALRGDDGFEKDRLFGKMLREANDKDVWFFVTPKDVADSIDRLSKRIGRRLPFWKYLIEGWRQDGLL